MTVVAVSGASGFVGVHLCQELKARGHEVRALSRAQLGRSELATCLQQVHCFIHLAARAHVLREQSADPEVEFREVNVRLTQGIAQSCLRAGVRRFVFMSSAGVLGATSPADGFHEDSAPDPHDAYTASKLEAERWLTAELAASLELVILRPPLIYGPGAKGNLMRLLRLALKGWPLPLGALRAPRSMVAIRNLVDLLALIAATSSPVRGTLLIADRETISVAALFRTVAQYAGHSPWLAPLPPALIKSLLVLTGRHRDIERLTGPFVLHPQAAQRLLGWMPPYPLASELRRTVLLELERAQGITNRAQ